MSLLVSRTAISWFLLASDLIGSIICFHLAFLIRLNHFLPLNSPLLYGMIFLIILGLYIADTYKLEVQIAGLWAPARVLLSLGVTFCGISSLIYFAGWWGKTPIVGHGILLLSVLLFAIWALSCRWLTSHWLKMTLENTRWLVMGNPQKATQLEKDYRRFHPVTEFIYADNFDLEVESVSANLSGLYPDLKTRSILPWSGILIDDEIAPIPDSTIRQLMSLRLQGIYIYKFSEFYEKFWRKIPPSCIKEDWFAFTSGFSLFHQPINLKLKRLFDLLGSVSLLVLTVPVMGAIALAIILDSPGSIFYHQVRSGLNGRPFKLHKFRSMVQDAEKMGIQWAAQQDTRLTRVGKWLRLTRLDELPQLWNVLKGQMSLIGPRPERPEFDSPLRDAIAYYDIRYLVKPGITGWAQVNYPYGASVEDAYQKVAYDLYYIKNYSLLLDAAIVFKTLRVILLGKGR